MQSRCRLGVLAVCALALSVMAISVSSAHATVMVMVNGADVGTGVELKGELSVEIMPTGEKKEKRAGLITTSGKNKVEILCSEITNTVGVATLESIQGTSNVNKCVTFINGKEEAGCNPLGQPVKGGGIATTALVAGVPYGKAEGPGGVFMTVKFNEETCVALPPSVKITGVAWGEDVNGEAEVERVAHVVQEATAPAKELGGLLFGANAASLVGSVSVSLADEAHKGMTYSGLAK